VAPHAVAGFLAAVFPLIAIPGASLALLTQRVAAHGAGQGVPVVLGTVAGLYVHATLALAGLSALVLRSSELFAAVRLAGAAYLVVLGVYLWRGPRSPARQSAATGRSTFLQALLGNVLNPKAAAIYLTLVPQFLDPGRPLAPQLLVLATAHALLITVWLSGWTALLWRAGRAMRSARFGIVARRIAGVVLVAMGVRAATT
jgi:threonine/homoserine/homoserine lactone efflux protein